MDHDWRARVLLQLGGSARLVRQSGLVQETWWGPAVHVVQKGITQLHPMGQSSAKTA